MQKLKQILISGLAALMLIASLAPTAAAQQIPAGYALVPISSLSGTTTPSTPSKVTISTEKSSLRANEELGFAGGESIKFTATLRDTTGAPLAGRQVSLIGSRLADQIQAVSATTNSNGEAIFLVNTKTEGVSAFTATDTATGTVIATRVRVAFLKATGGGIGGNENLLGANLLAQVTNSTAGLYEEFLKADFPTNLAAGTPSDLTLSITDASGKVNENYTGTVTFMSTDPLAILPRDYSFTQLDRGVHTFANAVTLATSGTTKITITADTITAPIEISVSVTDGTTATTGNTTPIINEPADGALANSGSTTIRGTAPANTDLVLLIDDSVSADASSDLDGNFEVPTTLTDGTHELRIATLTADGSVAEISDPISITVATAKPELTSLNLAPSFEVNPNMTVDVSAQATPGLAEVTLGIGDKSLTLFESSAGLYTGQINASTPGEYTLTLTLTDKAGNSTTESNFQKLKIATPLTIRSIIATPASASVQLTWEPPANHAEVDHYVIRYGRSTNVLEDTFTTTDSRTDWTITELNNDTTYYFKIYSYNTDGQSNGYSETVSAVPTAKLGLRATACNGKVVLDWYDQPPESGIARYQVNYGLEKGNYIEKQLVSEDLLSWEVRNLVNDVNYYFTIRGLDAANQEIFTTNEEVAATPAAGLCREAAGAAPIEPVTEPIKEYPIQLWEKTDASGATILVWNPVPEATSYRVYAGTQPNFFDLPTAEVTTPYLKPVGLDAGKEYFFAVRAVYAGSHEASNFSNVARVEVGPAEALALAAGLALLAGLIIQWRRKVS